MKHMKRIAICGAAALTALFAAACSSKSNEPTPAGERVITFKTDIGAFTRAPQLDADGVKKELQLFGSFPSLPLCQM